MHWDYVTRWDFQRYEEIMMAKSKAAPKQLGPGDDKQYIRDYMNWNAWPFCPLKRKNSELRDKNLGFLLATQEHADAVKGKGRFTVFHAYMFDPPKGSAEYAATPKTEYDTVDALLADGWMVD